MEFRYVLPIAVVIAVLSLMLPTHVYSADGHGCAHEPTVQSLRTCVEHADSAGHIDSPRVTKVLLKLLDAAQIAQKFGQKEAAVNALNGFIKVVEVQSGRHIVPEHATHLIMHANQVIEAIGT